LPILEGFTTEHYHDAILGHCNEHVRPATGA